MISKSSLRSMFLGASSQTVAPTKRRTNRRYRPLGDFLEDRALLSTLTVTSNAGDPVTPGDLLTTLAQANADGANGIKDTVVFAKGVSLIVLQQQAVVVAGVTVNGGGVVTVELPGSKLSAPAFSVTGSASPALTILQGLNVISSPGGFVSATGSAEMTLINDTTSGCGGAPVVSGVVSVTNGAQCVIQSGSYSGVGQYVVYANAAKVVSTQNGTYAGGTTTVFSITQTAATFAEGVSLQGSTINATAGQSAVVMNNVSGTTDTLFNLHVNGSSAQMPAITANGTGSILVTQSHLTNSGVDVSGGETVSFTSDTLVDSPIYDVSARSLTLEQNQSTTNNAPYAVYAAGASSVLAYGNSYSGTGSSASPDVEFYGVSVVTAQKDSYNVRYQNDFEVVQTAANQAAKLTSVSAVNDGGTSLTFIGFTGATVSVSSSTLSQNSGVGVLMQGGSLALISNTFSSNTNTCVSTNGTTLVETSDAYVFNSGSAALDLIVGGTASIASGNFIFNSPTNDIVCTGSSLTVQSTTIMGTTTGASVVVSGSATFVNDSIAGVTQVTLAAGQTLQITTSTLGTYIASEEIDAAGVYTF